MDWDREEPLSRISQNTRAFERQMEKPLEILTKLEQALRGTGRDKGRKEKRGIELAMVNVWLFEWALQKEEISEDIHKRVKAVLRSMNRVAKPKR